MLTPILLLLITNYFTILLLALAGLISLFVHVIINYFDEFFKSQESLARPGWYHIILHPPPIARVIIFSQKAVQIKSNAAPLEIIEY